MAEPVETYQKDPQAVLDYAIDWSGWLPEGDDLASAVFTTDLPLAVDSSSFSDGKATVWLSGGVAGQSYDVVSHIVSVQGRTDERTIRIECVER